MLTSHRVSEIYPLSYLFKTVFRFSLQIVNVSSGALLSPQAIACPESAHGLSSTNGVKEKIEKDNADKCEESDTVKSKEQGRAGEEDPTELKVRWTPLFAEPDSRCHNAERGGKLMHMECLEAAGDKSPKEWQLLRLQQRVRVTQPKVVALGSGTAGDKLESPTTKRMRPCAVQSVVLRFKNEGLADVWLSVHPNFRALKVRWRGAKHNNGSSGLSGPRTRTTNCTSSSDNASTGNEWETAWLLRVEEDEIEGLEKETDAASFCLCPFIFPFLCPPCSRAPLRLDT